MQAVLGPKRARLYNTPAREADAIDRLNDERYCEEKKYE
jgi:hypothetical protein